VRRDVLGIPIDWLDPTELEQTLIQLASSKTAHQITTVNPEFMVLAQKNHEFKSVLQASDLSLADGTGIVLAQTYLDTQPRGPWIQRQVQFILLGLRYLTSPHSFKYKRITGVDLTDLILALADLHRWKIFLLGAAPGVAKKAAEVWQATYPNLDIVGVSSANPDDEKIISTIKEANPDILLVAYGAPKQDLFIAKHKEGLNIPIMVGVGGTFDYATGRVFRAPAILRAIGLEWFVRLIFQPRRIARIYRSTFGFMRLVINHR
jgi:N-acetylglucosaminyldiphosphoundecaprenol N-acetyl-beta-D-mannosaminyltransferase